MSNDGFDWADLFDDFENWIDDLWPSSGGDPGLMCVFAVGRQFARGTPEYTRAIEECRQQFDITLGGGSDPVAGIRSDIGDFLDDLLGGVTGGLDGLLDGLGDRLRDAIGGLGRAGETTVGNVGDIAGTILGQVGTNSQRVIDIIGLSAGGAIDTVGGVLGDITAGVGDTINDFLRAIRDAIERAINAMTRAISDSLRAAIDTVTRVVSNIVDQIQDVVTRAIDGLTNLLERVIDSVQELIQGAIERISEVAEAVFRAVETVVEDIRDTLVRAFDDITQFVGDQITQAGEFINEATTTLQGIGAGIVDSAEALYSTITEGIDAAIAELVDVSSGALAAVREGLDNLQTAVTAGLEGLGPVLNEFVVQPTTEATRGLVESIAGQIDQKIITLQEGMEQMFTCMGLPKEAADKARSVINCIFPSDVLFGPLLQNVLVFIAQIMVAMGFASQLANAAGIKALQDIQPSFPIALPDPAMVQEMARFSLVEDDKAIVLLQKNGFSTEDSRRILDIKRRLPDVGIVQTWFLRDFVSREEALALLSKLGFEEPDSSQILDMAFFIPPVSDLITMAVREVFSPEIAERFGQFQDFPPAFAQYAKQQGITEEWARNYWAAHWALPSVQMGFEMLHRKVITQEDLELLLRSQDVMPFWRDKLVAISYSPLTRVDVRRMHKMGVLDDAAVKKAYQDIGYDDTNAELLLQFTKELNAPAEGATPEQLDELTRSAVTNLYGAGTLSRQDAFELLQAIGVGSAASIIFLNMVDLRNETEQRQAQTQLILDQAKAGIIRFSEAEDKLNALGLEPLEVQRALTKLQAAQDATVKLPSPQQLDDMLRANIIGPTVYLDTMLRLGYSPFWAENLLQLARSTP